MASDNIAFQLAAIDNLLLDSRDHWLEQACRADRADHVGHFLGDYRRIMPGVSGLAILDAGGSIQAIEALLVATDLATAYALVAELAGRLRFQEALAKLVAFRPPSP